MSISRRLLNMARAELNSLLDRAVEAEQQLAHHHDPNEDLYRRFSLDEISDAELEAEIERRYRARQAGARTGAPRAEAANPAGRAKAANPRPRPSPSPRPPAVGEELRRAYAALEVPVGADFATVRTSYRALLRKYHPDRHAGSPEKQKAATELTQKLTQAYKLIGSRSRS